MKTTLCVIFASAGFSVWAFAMAHGGGGYLLIPFLIGLTLISLGYHWVTQTSPRGGFLLIGTAWLAAAAFSVVARAPCLLRSLSP